MRNRRKTFILCTDLRRRRSEDTLKRTHYEGPLTIMRADFKESGRERSFLVLLLDGGIHLIPRLRYKTSPGAHDGIQEFIVGQTKHIPLKTPQMRCTVVHREKHPCRGSPSPLVDSLFWWQSSLLYSPIYIGFCIEVGDAICHPLSFFAHETQSAGGMLYHAK